MLQSNSNFITTLVNPLPLKIKKKNGSELSHFENYFLTLKNGKCSRAEEQQTLATELFQKHLLPKICSCPASC